MIYVTHDQVEAMTLADRIVVLNAGKIEQVGTPLELYRNPVNTFVAGFIASQRMNFLEVSIRNNQLVVPGNKVLTRSHPKLAEVRTIGVRPEHLELTDPNMADLSGTLSVIEQFGEYALAYVELPTGELVTVKLDGAPDLKLHETVHIRVPADAVHLFNDAGRALR
jgi:ABC-type sugar transport system ATPase subunit